MFDFFAYTFGYVLNFIYNIVCNYGWAIILFTIFVKLLLLPISIKQQRTMKKSAKLQEQMKALQFKYKNDQQKMNQEMMNLYKSEHMSPFSGCLSAIVQIILLLSVFYLVRSPLTFMKQVPQDVISAYKEELKTEEKIADNNPYPEIAIIREKGQENEQVNVNMDFLGLDLSQIPNQNMEDFRVYIIPVLYIISSIISMKITTSMQKQQNVKKKQEVIDITEETEENEESKELKEKEEEKNDVDVAMQTNKTMTWLIPIMAISIAFVAPLGLALYWLVNNILMIIERIALNKFLKEEE